MTIAQATTHDTDIQAWRAKRDDDLRAPDGWLTITNLFMLSDGEFTLGSAAGNDIVLPASAPAHLGTLTFKNQQATLRVTADEPVLVGGQPLREAVLEDNTNRKPTLVQAGTAVFFIHHFAGQFAVRVKDTSHPARESFAGNQWFDAKPEYHVPGKLVRFDQARAVPIDTIHHYPSEYNAVGTVEFELQGRHVSLLATKFYNEGQLNISFRDATSGKQTYGLVRFLVVNVDKDDNVDVDFNKAVNPPCAYTPFATCPLAPAQNVLPFPIEAGELYSQAVVDIYNSFLPAAQAHP